MDTVGPFLAALGDPRFERVAGCDHLSLVTEPAFLELARGFLANTDATPG